ncbi:hypothetical protein ACLQ2N_32810 [Streptomyces sp. DT224]|uniref:hypothetical protein n=1 Tax=Streptomyces sp. DT224 TaxID=3393426 RepID=UPI003CF10C26
MNDPERPTIRYVAGRPMQCKDIPDEALLNAVRRTPQPYPNPPHFVPLRMSWDVQTALEEITGPLPYKLFLAKIRRLFHKGLLCGCDCGCRGDYHLSLECLNSTYGCGYRP